MWEKGLGMGFPQMEDIIEGVEFMAELGAGGP